MSVFQAQIFNRDKGARFAVQRVPNRYYTGKSVQCRNCNKMGHLSKNCPEPKVSTAYSHRWTHVCTTANCVMYWCVCVCRSCCPASFVALQAIWSVHVPISTATTAACLVTCTNPALRSRTGTNSAIAAAWGDTSLTWVWINRWIPLPEGSSYKPKAEIQFMAFLYYVNTNLIIAKCLLVCSCLSVCVGPHGFSHTVCLTT